MATGSVAGSVWAAQNAYFRRLAKSLGDTRVDKTFPGKLLRRVEITSVALVGGALFCFACLSLSLTLPLASLSLFIQSHRHMVSG